MTISQSHVSIDIQYMFDEHSSKTILIVEDEIPMLNALCDKLTREGFIMLQARDGVEGLGAALKNHPDLILLDIIMPKMDGMEMLNKLRGDEAWGKNVPVILLTNLNEPGKVADALAHDVHEYLVKSDWTLENIIKKIKERLEPA